jgi:hypothetical protein
VGVEDLGQLTVVVLHPVALVHDHVLPPDLWGERERWRRRRRRGGGEGEREREEYEKTERGYIGHQSNGHGESCSESRWR